MNTWAAKHWKTIALGALWIFLAFASRAADLILINPGNEPNDGLGDSSYTASKKANTNFVNLNAEHFSFYAGLSNVAQRTTLPAADTNYSILFNNQGNLGASSNFVIFPYTPPPSTLFGLKFAQGRLGTMPQPSSLLGAQLTHGRLATPDPQNGALNILDYGAKGDGINDDTAAIQRAINSLRAVSTPFGGGVCRNGTIFIPAGVWNISAPIQLPWGVSIVGDGRGASVIFNTTKTSDSIQTVPNMNGFTQPFSIRNLIIQGSEQATAGVGVRINFNDGPGPWPSMENVCILGHYNCLWMDTLVFGTFKNCQFHGATGDGVRGLNNCNVVQFENCWFYGCKRNGAYFDRFDTSKFVACSFQGNTNSGLVLDQSWAAHIDACDTEANGNTGMVLSNSFAMTITGYATYLNTNGDLAINGAQGLTMSGFNLQNWQGNAPAIHIEPTVPSYGAPSAIVFSGDVISTSNTNALAVACDHPELVSRWDQRQFRGGAATTWGQKAFLQPNNGNLFLGDFSKAPTGTNALGIPSLTVFHDFARVRLQASTASNYFTELVSNYSLQKSFEILNSSATGVTNSLLRWQPIDLTLSIFPEAPAKTWINDTLSVGTTNNAGPGSITALNLNATSITLNGDTRTAWPSGGGGGSGTNHITGDFMVDATTRTGSLVVTNNATVNGSLSANSLNAPSITLNGDTRTAWPSGGGGAPAGTVTTNGGSIAVNDIAKFTSQTNIGKATAQDITNAIGSALDSRYLTNGLPSISVGSVSSGSETITNNASVGGGLSVGTTTSPGSGSISATNTVTARNIVSTNLTSATVTATGQSSLQTTVWGANILEPNGAMTLGAAINALWFPSLSMIHNSARIHIQAASDSNFTTEFLNNYDVTKAFQITTYPSSLELLRWDASAGRLWFFPVTPNAVTLNGPVTVNSLTTPTITLNGDTRTAWPGANVISNRLLIARSVAGVPVISNSVAQFPWPLPLNPNCISNTTAYVDSSAADMKLVMSNAVTACWQDFLPANYFGGYTVHIAGNMETATSATLILQAEIWPMASGASSGTPAFAAVNLATNTTPGTARWPFTMTIGCTNTGSLAAEMPYQLRLTMNSPSAQLFNITKIYASWDPK